jgi:DNA end-binding protein Ku
VPRREGRSRRRTRLVGPDEIPGGTAFASRPIWSGSLSFGLVSVPLELYSAQRSGGVPLRMLSPEGVPLAREYVCPKEDKSLSPDEIVRGYEVDEDEFVVVSDEELAALAPRRSRDIELKRFVDRREIDPVYFIRAYYLVPTGEQTKAYRLLTEIMEQTGRAAIASFVMREQAYAIAIFAESGILRGATLRFADELRTPETIGLPEARRVDAARVRAVEKAVSALAERRLAEDELRDDASLRLLALARKKHQRGQDVVEVPEQAAAEAVESEGAEVIDLMALLKERLGASGERGRPAKMARSKTRRRRAASRRG